jgi:hypothetical protein
VADGVAMVARPAEIGEWGAGYEARDGNRRMVGRRPCAGEFSVHGRNETGEDDMPDQDPKREQPITQRSSGAPHDAERGGGQAWTASATWIDEPAAAAASERQPATRKYYEF